MTDPVLLLAVFLQYLAAFLAFRLIRISGNRKSWGLISLAILLMALRHSVSYLLLLSGGRPPMDLRAEWVTLISSLFMASGVALIGPLFRSMERSREKLKESERRYRNIFDLATVSIWEEDFREVQQALERLKAEGVTDFRAWFREHPDFIREAAGKVKVLDVNPATLALYGARSKEEMLGSLNKVFTSESFPVFEEILVALAEGRKTFSSDAVNQTLQGEKKEVFLSMSVSPELPDYGNLLISIIDITDRRRNERRLKLFRTLIDQSNDAIFVIDLKTGRFLDMNEMAGESLGYRRHELLERGVTDIDPDVPDAAAWEESARRIRERGWAIREGRLRTRSGKLIPVELNGKRVVFQEKEYIVAVVRDISERKRSEAALQESEEKYRNLFHQSSDGIVLYDLSGRILDVNEKSLQLLGYSRSELLDMNIFELHPASFRERSEAVLDRIKREKQINFEGEFLTKQGSVFPAEVSCNLFTLGGREVIQGIVRDISERKKMEAEQQRIGKLESLGVLAGGIAHDFNNLLTAILGNINIIKKESKPGTLVFERAEKAEKASLRAKGLTKQLLTFTRGRKPAKMTASLKRIIRDSAEFALTGTNVKCGFSIAEDLWLADVDVDQIGQVINNLALNAVQAMPEGGMIRIGASNVTDPLIAGGKLAPGRYVRIVVEDEGVGIAGKDLPKIFDPYFTTKEKGSGLGLASAYSILRQHGGRITATSVEGKGATFEVYLPASSKSVRNVHDRKERGFCGRGRILVMDDETFVLDVAGKMLGQMGFEAVYAKDGAAAVDLYRKALQEKRPFVAVIMDLTIPGGMGGKETQKLLKKIDPDVTTIVSSGYSDDPILSAYKAYGFQGVLLKPYRLTEMSEVLGEVLSLQAGPLL